MGHNEAGSKRQHHSTKHLQKQKQKTIEISHHPLKSMFASSRTNKQNSNHTQEEELERNNPFGLEFCTW